MKKRLKRITRYALLITLILLAACAPAAAPTPTWTLVPSLTSSPTGDIQAAVEATLTALAPTQPPAEGAQNPTFPPEGDLGILPTVPTIDPEATADPNATAAPSGENGLSETPIVVTLPALAGERIPPPLDITLPGGWEIVGYDVQVLTDLDGTVRGFPLAAWGGPVTGGSGTIVLYWGFPNLNLVGSEVIVGAMSGTAPAPDVWSDGLRLLNLAVIERGCTVGTDQRRAYQVGLISAVGTQFSAVNCPELPNTRGWFAALQEQGLNFVFYALMEGAGVMDNQNLDAYNTARGELQAILDTVRFRVPESS